MKTLTLIIDIFPLWMRILFLVFAFLFIFRKTEILVMNLPPGPIGISLLLHACFSKAPYKGLAQLNKTYGTICSASFIFCRQIIVSDYDTAKELLCHPATLCRPQALYSFAPGTGGFSGMDEDEWAVDKRRFMKALVTVGLGTNVWTDIIQDDLEKILDYIATSEGQPINVQLRMSLSTMCSFLALALGRRFVNDLTESDLMLILEGDKESKKQILSLIFATVLPWLPDFLAKFNIARYGHRKKALHAVGDMVRKEVIERRISEKGDEKMDITKQYFKEIKQVSFDNNSVESLVGNIVAYTIGSETAICGSLWLLHIMAAYPKIQGKVQDEVDSVVGRNVKISWEDRKKLPFTMACIHEMIRWVAISPIFAPRCASETFEFHGYSIPKGSIIVINGWGLSRDPKYWDRADEYIPERFLHTNAQPNFKLEGYAPFSFGKRSCPGKQIALMVMFLSFTGIMQKFEVRTPTGEPPDLTPLYHIITEPKYENLSFIKRE